MRSHAEQVTLAELLERPELEPAVATPAVDSESVFEAPRLFEPAPAPMAGQLNLETS